jgi:predicted nucleic acid-binding protein
MTHLLDTDVVINLLAGREATIRVVDALDVDPAISAITVGEYYEGFYGSEDPPAAERRFELALDSFVIYDVDLPTMKRCGWIRRSLRDSGQLIPDFDIVIAATALERNLTLITRNTKHFARITGLKIFDWSALPGSPSGP